MGGRARVRTRGERAAVPRAQPSLDAHEVEVVEGDDQLEGPRHLAPIRRGLEVRVDRRLQPVHLARGVAQARLERAVLLWAVLRRAPLLLQHLERRTHLNEG